MASNGSEDLIAFSDSAFQQGDTYNNDGAVRALVLDAGNGIAPIEGHIARALR